MRGAQVRLSANRPGWVAEPPARPVAANDNLALRSAGRRGRDPAPGVGASIAASSVPDFAVDAAPAGMLPVWLALGWVTVTLIAIWLAQYHLALGNPARPGPVQLTWAENIVRR